MRLILTSGLTLFEVLISLLLLSFVLLGLDAMELSALNLHHRAAFSALAEQQMHNIEERLRSLGGREDLDAQVAAWNQENSVLLPQGRGRVEGRYPDYVLTLSWGEKEEERCLREEFII